MLEGSGQRVVAAAEASGTGSFHSESELCFWGRGARQGGPHTKDSPQALEGSVHGLGLLLTSPSLPLITGVSFKFHGSFLPKPLMCLESLMGRKHGRAEGPWSANIGCTSGRAASGHVAAEASLRACVCGGGWRLCMDRGLAAFLHFRSVTFSSECTSDANTPFKLLRKPHRQKRLERRRSLC